MSPKESLLAWKVFQKTSQTLNISRTAIELDLDLKTASRILKELEKNLGFSLFDRSSRPFKMTQEAELILPCVHQLLKSEDKLSLKLQEVASKPIDVRLSLPVNMTRDDLFPVMAKYRELHPKFNVRFLNDCDHQHLLDGETDIVMLPYRPENANGDLVLFDAGFSFNMLLASPKYVARNGSPSCVEDLKNHVLILRDSRIYPTTRSLEHADLCVSLTSDFKLVYLGDAFSCRSAALLGHGIAVDLSVAYCSDDIKDGRLIPLLPGWHRPRWDMTIAIRKEDAENKPLYEFASWFANTQKKAYPKRWGPIFEKYGVTP